MEIKDVKTLDDVREFRKTVLSKMPRGDERKALRKELSEKRREIIRKQ